MYSGDRVPYHHLPPRADEDVDRSPATVHCGRARYLGRPNSVAIRECSPLVRLSATLSSEYLNPQTMESVGGSM